MAGNATMTALALGIDPEPLGVAPFIMSAAHAARAASPPTSGWPCTHAPGRCVPGARRVRRRRHRGRHARLGHGPRQAVRLFIDVGTNCEIVLGDGERILATAAPPGRRSRAARSGAACARPTARSRSSSSPTTTSSCRSSATSSRVGLCGSGLVDAVAELVRVGLLDASGRFVHRRGARRSRPRWPTGSPTIEGSGSSSCTAVPARPARLGLPLPARRPRAAVRQGRHRDRLAPLLEEFGLRAARRAAGAAGGFVRDLPVRRPRGPDRAGPEAAGAADRCAGNVAGEGAKMALLSAAGARRRQALLEEVTYVELSDRTDFNDRSSTSSPSRELDAVPDRIALVACGAIAQPAGHRRASRLAGRRPPPAAAAAQPSRAHRRRGRAAAVAAPRLGASPSAMPTAAPTARSTRSARRSRCAAAGGLHCYDVYAGAAAMQATFFRRTRHVRPEQ